MLWRCHADFVNWLPNPFFHFKSFSILSQDKGLRVTTDACLLGTIAKVENDGKILDIGTGTGVVALLMAQRYPERSIDAIEIEPVVAQQARFNIQNCPFKDRIQLIEANFLQYDTAHQYACIVSNPPYFKDHLEKIQSEKNTAIHATLLNHQAMIEKVAKQLQKDGYFYCILPPFQMQTLIALAEAVGLKPESITQIFNKPEKHYRDIVCFSSKATDTQQYQLLLHDETGNKTDEFHRLMGDFYLEDTSIYKKNKQ